MDWMTRTRTRTKDELMDNRMEQNIGLGIGEIMDEWVAR